MLQYCVGLYAKNPGRHYSANPSFHSQESEHSEVRHRRPIHIENGSGHEFIMTDSNVDMGYLAINFCTSSMVWCVVSFLIIFLAISLVILGIIIGLSFCKCI